MRFLGQLKRARLVLRSGAVRIAKRLRSLKRFRSICSFNRGSMFTYQYARPAVSVDLIVPRQFDQRWHILLIQRKYDPFAFCWALPGGFMEIDETLEQAAVRELREETGLIASEIDQLETFSDLTRDPRGRVLTTVFIAQTDANQQPVADDDAADFRWVDVQALPKLAFDHDRILGTWLDKGRRVID